MIKLKNKLNDYDIISIRLQSRDSFVNFDIIK